MLVTPLSCPHTFTYHKVSSSASSVISLGGKLLVSRIQELALWNTFPEALQLSSGLGKKVDMEETPTRFPDTMEASKVDQPKLMFTVNQVVVLRGFTVFKGAVASREVTITLKQVGGWKQTDPVKSSSSCNPPGPQYCMADLHRHKEMNTIFLLSLCCMCTHLTLIVVSKNLGTSEYTFKFGNRVNEQQTNILNVY